MAPVEPSHPQLEDDADGILTLWSGPPPPPPAESATSPHVVRNTWLTALAVSALLGPLSWAVFAYRLECTRAQARCTVSTLLESEEIAFSAIGRARVSNSFYKGRTTYAVSVPGLPHERLISTRDEAQARDVAARFNAVLSGRAERYGKSGLGGGPVFFLAVFLPLIVALKLTGKQAPYVPQRTPLLRLTSHHLAFKPLPPALGSHPAPQRAVRSFPNPTRRLDLPDVAFFDVQNTSEVGQALLQVVSRAPAVYDVLLGPREEMEHLRDAFNARLDEQREHRGLA